jgi:hypothetical protein
LIEDAKDLVDKGAKRQWRWLADADDIDVTILLLMHARVPPGHSSCPGRSGTFCHECQARSFDRDADIYGIRALNSCRARQNTCSIREP